MTTLRRRLQGAAALLALVALMVGLHAALTATVGNPLTGSSHTAGQWWQALTAPDDGTLALTAIGLLGL